MGYIILFKVGIRGGDTLPNVKSISDNDKRIECHVKQASFLLSSSRSLTTWLPCAEWGHAEPGIFNKTEEIWGLTLSTTARMAISIVAKSLSVNSIIFFARYKYLPYFSISLYQQQIQIH